MAPVVVKVALYYIPSRLQRLQFILSLLRLWYKISS